MIFRGLQGWRIDGKSEELSTVPKGNLGVFRSDDCYILLQVSVSRCARFRYLLTLPF